MIQAFLTLLTNSQDTIVKLGTVSFAALLIYVRKQKLKKVK